MQCWRVQWPSTTRVKAIISVCRAHKVAFPRSLSSYEAGEAQKLANPDILNRILLLTFHMCTRCKFENRYTPKKSEGPWPSIPLTL